MAEITFNDILIEPAYSEIISRSHVDLTTDLGKITLKLPVISANMKQITGAKMAYSLWKAGGLGFMHRFNTIDQAIADFQDAQEFIKRNDIKAFDTGTLDYKPRIYSEKEALQVGVSLGVHDEDKKRFHKLYEYGARFFCIDVAHGHHILMKNMIQWIRQQKECDNNVVILAGNVATPKGALDLAEWGADIIKVGIGPGGVCQTRRNTGVGVPQLQAVKDIREMAIKENMNLKIVADGGIKHTGDIAKALIFADAVMIGSFIAGTSETPGDVYEDVTGKFYKVYGGSASAENKVSSGKDNKFVEGMMITVPFRGHVKYLLKRIQENVQSAFSYTGANNMLEYREKVVYRIISGSGRDESKL